jgi:hypothetical protein
MKILNNKINPAFISGFIQADGVFHVDISRSKDYKLGVRVTPSLHLSQHTDSINILHEIKEYFNVGHITTNKNRNEANYIVNSFPKLKEVILPHFDKYTLKSGKFESYVKFKEIINLMDKKAHLNADGLIKIIELSYDLNFGTQRKLENKEELIHLILEKSKGVTTSVKIPLNSDLSNINESSISPEFISGLTDGDGSFFVSFRKNRRITVNYTIIQDSDSKSVLTEVKDYFNCGKVYDLKSRAARFQVENLTDITNIIIPHFMEYSLKTNKIEHFQIFCKVCELLLINDHKTNEGYNRIIELAYDMNNKGKGRRLSKKDFIELIENKDLYDLE